MAGFVASTNNRFDVLCQKHFEKQFLNIPKQVRLEREAAKEAARLEALAQELGTVDKPFINKGKVRDFRDTGIPGINNEELDPENQRRALESFGFLKGEDPEMQKAMVKRLFPMESNHISSLSLRLSLNSQTLIEVVSAILQLMLVERCWAMVRKSPLPLQLQALRNRNSTMGTNNGKSKSSSPSLLKAGNSGGIRGHSQNMIDVSRKAMHSNKYRETPNVRTGPAFAADQVAPNSYLQMILVTPAQSHLLHLLRLHQMMSLGRSPFLLLPIMAVMTQRR